MLTIFHLLVYVLLLVLAVGCYTICLINLLLACCSVVHLCLLFSLHRTIIYVLKDFSISSKLVSRLRTGVFFLPRPILPAAFPQEPSESHQGEKNKRRGYSGQSIDRLMAAGWGVTLLKTRARLSHHVTAPRWNLLEKWGTSDHRLGTSRMGTVQYAAHGHARTILCCCQQINAPQIVTRSSYFLRF
jgi:hypothetical protein